MQNEGRNLNRGQQRADIRPHVDRLHSARGGGSGTSMPGSLPPSAKGLVAGDARSSEGEVVEPTLDGVGLHVHLEEPLQYGLWDPKVVTVRSGYPGGPVDDDQAADPVGIGGCQEDGLE